MRRLAVKIRKIAAAAARHQNLFADFVRAFKNDYLTAAVTSRFGTEQPGRTTANDDDVVIRHV